MSIAELIIGMSLAVLLVGMTIPKVDPGYMKAKWERRRLCSEIRYLKRRDLAGIEEFMRIDEVDGKTCYKILFRSKVLRKLDVDEDISVKTGIDMIKFQENGKPNKSGEINVIYKKKFYSITITPISGRILFKEGIYDDSKK